MKRFLLVITALAFLAIPAVFVGVPTAAAVPICPDGEPAASDGSCTTALNKPCYDKWDGEAPLKDSDKAKEYAKSGCDKSDGGSCTSKTVTKDGKKRIEINCKKPVSSGGGSSSSDGYIDEAANSDACTDDSCEIINKFVNPLIKVLSVLVGIAAAIGIIIGAIQYSTSAGDPQKATSGKNHIRNAIIAIVAYALLFVALNWLIPGGVL